MKHYAGTYRSVKIDWYYTSIELAVEFEKLQLYTTGTVMTNRIPKELCSTKKKARDTPTSDYDRHAYQ